MALIEAVIDFGEEQELEEQDAVVTEGENTLTDSLNSVLIPRHHTAKFIVSNLLNTIQFYLRDSWRGEILRSGVSLPIYGPPNVGKSTLFNLLGMCTVVTSGQLTN